MKLVETIILEGEVVHGFSRGSHLLGIRTGKIITKDLANIQIDDNVNESLKNNIAGVYFGYTNFKTNEDHKEIINKKFKSALSIGYNPYFNNSSKTVEIYLIDYDGEDFYKEIIELEIIGFLKSQSNYEGGLKELVTSITYDIIVSNSLL